MAFLAGAGTAAVGIEKILPIDGFTVANDDLSVRLVVLESDKRVVIGSMDMTSLGESTHEDMISLVAEVTGTERENVWLTLTHAFAGPHIFPKPVPGQSKPHRGPKLSPEDLEKMDQLQKLYEDALRAAGEQAVKNMKPAVIGAGIGTSNVNTSRNLPTASGWSLGSDPDDYVSKALGVIRVDYVDGTPAAVIYNYGVRSGVMSSARAEDGGKVVSGDLCENACRALEAELGCTALFTCGASADTTPFLTSKDVYTDADGNVKEEQYSYQESSVILKALSRRLASDVLKVRRGIETTAEAGAFTVKTAEVTCQTKDASPSANLADLVVTDKFVSDGEQTQTIFAMILGNIKLGGVKPEMDSLVAEGIQKAGATIAACMVNGSGKSMPSLPAYEKKQYSAFHSPFMPGSGEKVVEAMAELLK